MIWNKSIHSQAIEEAVQRYAKLSLKVERSLPRNPVVPRLKDQVAAFKDMLPVLNNLRNKDLKRRHWDKVIIPFFSFPFLFILLFSEKVYFSPIFFVFWGSEHENVGNGPACLIMDAPIRTNKDISLY